MNKGEIEADRSVGRLLGEAVSRIPQHSGPEFEKLFADNVQVSSPSDSTADNAKHARQGAR